MSLSKMHFEHMAEHIARNSSAGSPERAAMLGMAHSLGRKFNPNYDSGRMESAVEGLTKGTHTVGDSGRIKRVGRPRGVTIIDKEGSHRGTLSGNTLTRSGGGAGDEPRDDHGRWTK